MVRIASSMDIFFDVDQTILGMDNSLRPGAKETMTGLVNMGHRVHIWSGMGVRREVVKRHKLEGLTSGLYQKPLYDYHLRLEELGVPLIPDFVVDDDPLVVAAFGGLWVPPFYSNDADDMEMDRVLRVAVEFAKKGTSTDAHFRAKTSPWVSFKP